MKKTIMMVLAIFVASIFSVGAVAAQEIEQRPGPPKAIPGELGPNLEPGRDMDTFRTETVQFDTQAANDLEDMTLFNDQGQRIGEVDSVLVDIERGQIAYLVVSKDTATATEEKFVVPWKAIETSAERDGLVLSTPTELRLAIPEELSRIDRETGLRIHQYYGVSPYWE